MRTTIWTGICTAALSIATAAAMAQTTQPPQTSSTQPPQTASANDQKITVTGCLRDASADSSTTSGTVGTSGAGTGTTGTAGSAATAGNAAEPKFVLTNATTSAATTTTPPPASTDTRASDQNPSTQTYRLIANAAALTPHVGKKLEVVGTIDETANAASTGTDAASPFANAPKLRVESGKIVGASCDNK